MISIGCALRGPELRDSDADKAITAAAKAASELPGSFHFGSPAIHVVFHVAGSLGSPDWDWLRDGTFSPDEQLLIVQVAVPKDIVMSKSIRVFVVESLRGANAVAFEFFHDRELQFPLAEAEGLVDRINEKWNAVDGLEGQ
jgi:hypothetical protein